MEGVPETLAKEPEIPKKRRGASDEGIKKANKMRAARAAEIRKETIKQQADDSAESAIQRILKVLAQRPPDTESEVERPIAKKRKYNKAVRRSVHIDSSESEDATDVTDTTTDLSVTEATESEPEHRRRRRVSSTKHDKIKKRPRRDIALSEDHVEHYQPLAPYGRPARF